MQIRLVSLSLALVICIPAIARAQEDVSLDGYTCAQFLADTKQPADGEKLLKSLMMISWSTGYAAAYQKSAPRADAAAIRLIAATLGDACRKQPDRTAVSVIANAINQFVRPDSTEPGQAISGGSRWDYNGSILSLVADGASRQFRFETPKPELVPLGIEKSTLLFSGKKSGNQYSGTAYAFAASCRPKGYQVNGDIADDEKQITLRGKAPELGAGCKTIGYRDEVLVFKFLPNEPK